MKSKPVKGFFVKMNKNETQFIESDKGDYTRYEYDDGSTVFLNKPLIEIHNGNIEPVHPRYVGGIDPYTHPDTERLDKLQRLITKDSNGWILRRWVNNGGMRLYESEADDKYPTVREAIDAFDEREKTDKDT